jgi:hypothetical protein
MWLLVTGSVPLVVLEFVKVVTQKMTSSAAPVVGAIAK